MFPSPMTTGELADLLDATLEGAANTSITHLASLNQAARDSITFAGSEKHYNQMAVCGAAAVIVGADAPATDGLTLLRVSNVDLAIATLLAHIAPPEDLPELGIAPTACIDPTATIGQQVRIGAHVVIGPGCVVGDETSLLPGVVLGRDVTIGQRCVLQENVAVRQGCSVGDRVRLGASTVVGGDGFGYRFADGVHHKIVHAGTVVIESDVELGAHCCVDRAKWGQTVIGAGSKLDSLCQIAHNVQIGRGVVMAAQVGVAGSTVIGDYCVFGGKVGVRDNIEIAPQTQVAACSCIAQSITESGQTLIGIPARAAGNFIRENWALGKLPDLVRAVGKLKKKLN